MEKDLTASDLSRIIYLIDSKICSLNNSDLADEYCDKQIKILEKLRDKISFLY